MYTIEDGNLFLYLERIVGVLMEQTRNKVCRQIEVKVYSASSNC